MLEKISNKLKELKGLDFDFKIFGAASHKYIFNAVISENELSLFESKYDIKIPEDYRQFLKSFGNGGCGPGSGIFKLETGIYDIPLNKKQSEIIHLKKEFRFKTFWNLEDFSQYNYDVWENEYDKLKWADGMLRINHLGCGIYANLVLNGKEKGTIWIDSRTNEGGIYPTNYYNNELKNDFISWYLHWIESSIKELKANKL